MRTLLPAVAAGAALYAAAQIVAIHMASRAGAIALAALIGG